MKYLVLIISCFSVMNCQAQTSLNIELKKELEDILFKDQIYREFIDSETSEERKMKLLESPIYLVKTCNLVLGL